MSQNNSIQNTLNTTRQMVQNIAQNNINNANNESTIDEEKAKEVLASYEAIEDMEASLKLLKKESEAVLLKYYKQFKEEVVLVPGTKRMRGLRLSEGGETRRVDYDALEKALGKHKANEFIKRSPKAPEFKILKK